MARWILHVDLDQFIAAVEVLRRPELAGRPVVVGGRGDPTERGVVATASYEARAFGVHSGLPLRTAARRCPDAVFLPVDKPAYEAVSEVVMDTIRSVEPVLEVLGWDEAFLGVTHDEPEQLATVVQERVLAATGLACTVGIGQNKLQAKIATGYGKPAGVFRITDETWLPVLGARPPDALWGVGKRTAAKLAGIGVCTVADLAAADPTVLAGHFGPSTGPWLVQLGRGRGSTRIDGDPYVPRSRSAEITFQQNLDSWEQVRAETSALARRVGAEITALGRPAGRVVVKVRFAPFFTATHGQPVEPPSTHPPVIEAAALAALDKFDSGRPVRLLGVRAEFATPP